MGRIRSSIVMALAIAVGVLGISASPASADNETVSSFASIKPRGAQSKTERRAVDVHLEGKVTPGAGETKLRELLNVKLNLPTDLTFSTKGTPVCTNDIGQKNEENANRSTAAIIAECPKSVVGGGTAIINIAGSTSPAAIITDPELVIFNGGADSKGNPILLIHGYSSTVIPGGFGIIMRGVLTNGILDVAVPKLAADSAVTEFKFDLPGSRGKDASYAQAKCSSGNYRFNAVFTLADPDPNTGGFTNKQALTTNTTNQKCVGKAGSSGGKGKLASPKVSGPGKVKVGSKVTYKVKVKNAGKSTIKGVKVVAKGKGAKGAKKAGTLKRGKSKKVKVKVKFKKKGTVKLKIKVSGKGAKAKFKVKKVKVK